MYSAKTSVMALALAFSATASAETYTIKPDSVPLATRQRWCSDQTVQCPMICDMVSSGKPLVNTCDPNSLSYGCLCADNAQPNITEYSLTLPYYICTEWGNQCVTACGNHNNACAAACRQDHPCGALDPTRVNATTTTSASAASATSTSSSGPTLLSDSGSSKSKSAGVATSAEMGRVYGISALMAGLMAGFAML